MAVRSNDTKLLAMMLDRGASPNLPGNYWNEPPAYFAISRPEQMKLLLDAGADPNCRMAMKGACGQSLLHLAVREPQMETIVIFSQPAQT